MAPHNYTHTDNVCGRSIQAAGPDEKSLLHQQCHKSLSFSGRAKVTERVVDPSAGRFRWAMIWGKLLGEKRKKKQIRKGDSTYRTQSL